MPLALFRSLAINPRPIVQSTTHAGRKVHRSTHVVASGNDGDRVHTVGSVVQGTSTQEMLVVAKHVFDDAEREIREYCKTVKDAGRADQAMRVLESLQRSYDEAYLGCELDDRKSNSPSAACQQLDNLKQLLHELSYSGADGLIAVLAVKLGVEDERAKIMAEMTAPESDLEEDASVSFDAADSTRRGSLDKEQLLRALADVGYPMTHAEVNKALMALDAHGYVAYDTFLALVKTQAQRSRDGCDDDDSSTRFYGGVQHSRPSWWSEAPKSLDSMW